jgi:hypothetical protein
MVGGMVAIALVSCTPEDRACLALPCPLPLALTIRVTGAGGPVPGVTVGVSGAVSGMAQCEVRDSATLCYVPGTAGRYDLDIAAPGFQRVVESVRVQGSQESDRPCACPTVIEQQLDVVLVPAR